MLEKRRLIVSNSRCRGHHLTYSMNFPTITERNQTCSIEARASRLQSHSPLYHPGSLQHTLSWDLTISKATVLKIHEKPVIVHDWWLPDTCGLLSWRGELEVVFGKTRQLCMYVATWCEYGSFSLQYTVPINNSDRDPRQPRVLGGGGAISRGEKGVESAPVPPSESPSSCHGSSFRIKQAAATS